MSHFDRCVLLAFGLNALDVVLTLVLIFYMKFVESNPLMHVLITRSPLGFALTKLLAVGAVCLYLRCRRQSNPEMTGTALGVVVGMLFMICFWQTWMLIWTIELL